jgi:AmmeMemoRadiSam system protein A
MKTDRNRGDPISPSEGDWPAVEELSDYAKEQILRLAREALARTAEGHRLPEPDPASLASELREHRACFVTLRREGDLRGCMGNLTPREPLWEAIIRNAQAAAHRDPRFPALRTDELPGLGVEVSVLTPPRNLPFATPEELVDKLRPGADGVILRLGGVTATFLPQVWEMLPDPEDFLTHLCRKAGLEPDAWRDPNLTVQIYEVQKVE